jgi:hypothetical protein
MMDDLRAKIQGEEFDYQTLLSALDDYASPRDVITRLLRDRAVIRVKKGLYVFGPTYARRPYSRELLANLVYGPSYVSLEYALQYYGLIPEHVHAVTSVTVARPKRFQTPVGLFTYRASPVSSYWPGVTRLQLEPGVAALLATPEKALADKVRDDRGIAVNSVSAMTGYLMEDLRLDPRGVSQLDVSALDDLARLGGIRRWRLLAKAVRGLQRDEGGTTG